MAESYSRKDFWDGAGKAGLVLGLVSIVYMLIEQLLLQDAAEKLGTAPATLVTFLLWTAKFVGCILLMRWFMRRFANTHDGVTRRDASRYGSAIALTSALIYSAFVLAWSKFIDTEMFTRAFEQAAEQYSAYMDSNTMEMMEQMQEKYDLIILDPPAFAKHKDALHNALRGYTKLNAKAFEKIQPGGILFTFSCSQAVNKDQFRTAVFTAAAMAKRKVRILHQLHQPADHPINIYHPEGEYLKGLVLYVE